MKKIIIVITILAFCIGFFWPHSSLKSEIKSATPPNVEVSVYYKDLQTKQTLGVNENQTYPIASLSKVPLMMRILKQTETDKDLAGLMLNYQSATDENNKEIFKSTHAIHKGDQKTVTESLEYMVAYSDNNALNALTAVAEELRFPDIYQEFGFNLPLDKYNDHEMSPKQYSKFLESLATASYLNSKTSQQALDIMAKSDFTAGIAGLPVRVEHKFGERGNFETQELTLSDCGIIRTPDPYILCVMTKTNGFTQDTVNEKYTLLENTIADISEIVYKYSF
jgi:beta-lactamase class A